MVKELGEESWERFAVAQVGAAAAAMALSLALSADQLWSRDRFKWTLLRLILSMLATILLIIARGVTLSQGESGLMWLVVATVGTFLSSFLPAWVLLVEIKR